MSLKKVQPLYTTEIQYKSIAVLFEIFRNVRLYNFFIFSKLIYAIFELSSCVGTGLRHVRVHWRTGCVVRLTATRVRTERDGTCYVFLTELEVLEQLASVWCWRGGHKWA